MVEAAMVVPFLIIVFLALSFVHNLYSQKMATVAVSRERSWSYAMSSCKKNTSDVKQEDSGGMGSDPDMDLGKNPLGGAPGSETLTKGFAMAVSTVKGDATTKGKGITFSQKVQTTTWVPCNEEAKDGDLHGVFKTAWGLFSGW